MRLTIRYVSRFRYPDSAWDSHNVLRACPTTDDHQRLLDYQLEVEPAARVVSYIDSWGTRIDQFGVRDRHWELLVAARSTVETSERPAPGWESSSLEVAAFAEPAFRDAHWVYLQGTRHTRMHPVIMERAKAAAHGSTGAIDHRRVGRLADRRATGRPVEQSDQPCRRRGQGERRNLQEHVGDHRCHDPRGRS